MSLDNVIAQYVGNLVGSVSKTHTGTITINPMPMVQLADGTQSPLTECSPTLSANKAPDLDNDIGAEKFWLNNGVLNPDGSGTYDQVVRGIPNSESDPVPSGNLAWQTAHSEPSVVIIDATYEIKALKNSFDSNTTQRDDAVSGEAFAINDQLSLHSDGKYYKFHSTNYPNWIGTAGYTATAASEVGTIYLPGYIVPGYAGLTIGGATYADDGGTTVQTATATSLRIGYALSATENVLQAINPSGLEKSNTAENEAGTNDSKYVTPKGVRENTAADDTLAHLGEDETVTGAWNFTTAPEINGSEIATVDDVQDVADAIPYIFALATEDVAIPAANLQNTATFNGTTPVTKTFVASSMTIGYKALTIDVIRNSSSVTIANIKLKDGTTVLATAPNPGSYPSTVTLSPGTVLKTGKTYTVTWDHIATTAGTTTTTLQFQGDKYTPTENFQDV